LYKCDCGSTHFTPRVTVRVYDLGGFQEIPSGYKCVDCDSTMDSQRHAEMEKIRVAKAQLAEAQETLSRADQARGKKVAKEEAAPEL